MLGEPTANPAKIMRLLNEGRIVNFTSPAMMERLRSRLSSDKIQRYIGARFREELARDKPYVVMEMYILKSRIVEPDTQVEASSNPEDNEVLSVACYSKVDFLITLDRDDILSLRDPKTKEIVIEDEDGSEVCRFFAVTPREFIDILREIGLGSNLAQFLTSSKC